MCMWGKKVNRKQAGSAIGRKREKKLLPWSAFASRGLIDQVRAATDTIVGVICCYGVLCVVIVIVRLGQRDCMRTGARRRDPKEPSTDCLTTRA